VLLVENAGLERTSMRRMSWTRHSLTDAGCLLRQESSSHPIEVHMDGILEPSLDLPACGPVQGTVISIPIWGPISRSAVGDFNGAIQLFSHWPNCIILVLFPHILMSEIHMMSNENRGDSNSLLPECGRCSRHRLCSISFTNREAFPPFG